MADSDLLGDVGDPLGVQLVGAPAILAPSAGVVSSSPQRNPLIDANGYPKPGVTIPPTGPVNVGGPGATPQTPIKPGAKGESFLDALARIESGNANIFSRVDPDVAGPGSRSQGFFQINTPTWQDFAPKAGVDTTKFPNAMSAPKEVQAQVASVIPLSRFGPRTQEMLKQQFGQIDLSKPVGVYAGMYGGGGGGSTATSASRSSSSAPSLLGSSEAPSDLSAAQLLQGEMKLQILRSLFPQHQITQVEYDPWKVMPQGGATRPINVNEGVTG